MSVNLPKITYKQQMFVAKYSINGENGIKAYKYAYNCENMSENSIAVEASRLLKNPNVAQWIEYYRNNIQNHLDQEILYSADDAFQEFEELQRECMKSTKTYRFNVEKL